MDYLRRNSDKDVPANVTNRDLYLAIKLIEVRVGKMESKISYIFGGFAVGSVALAFIELVAHHT